VDEETTVAVSGKTPWSPRKRIWLCSAWMRSFMPFHLFNRVITFKPFKPF